MQSVKYLSFQSNFDIQEAAAGLFKAGIDGKKIHGME
jgi:hypothetical protein